MPHPVPDPIAPGQESVWDYPRPPALEPSQRRVRVELGGRMIADTERAWRVLETSHPPTYYIPPLDVDIEVLHRAHGATWCEWKGPATYFDLHVGDRVVRKAAWWYSAPRHPYETITQCLSFYPALVECFVDDERVRPQPGEFYGGWITSDVVGPFKGEPGSMGW